MPIILEIISLLAVGTVTLQKERVDECSMKDTCNEFTKKGIYYLKSANLLLEETRGSGKKFATHFFFRQFSPHSKTSRNSILKVIIINYASQCIVSNNMFRLRQICETLT